ncbi:MAG: AsmA family protein [Gammaproteobacteria bacterium]|nr:AsmA family protein [Gammaproteobacteria bacterium]MDP7419409.1 AsmA family protein [Gammaproteobacteria bacterium]HJP37814.1 AsmA family protein [Gammaproteobacteria bacterium]
MKQLLIGIIILVVVLAGGLIAAVITLNSIDLSDYEAPIADVVRDAIGRELHLNGALNINIGLTPGISVNDVSVQNADWASRDDMLLVEHVEVHLRLLPLVFGQIELSRLEIFGLDLMLETDQHGKGNWEFETVGDAAIDSESASTGDTFLTAAVLKETVIRDAAIVYKDGVSGTVQRFRIAELVAQMESAQAPLVVDLKASFGEEPVRLAGEITGISDLLAEGPLGLDLTADFVDATARVSGNIQNVMSMRGIDVAVSIEGNSLAAWSAPTGTEIPDLGVYRATAGITGSHEQVHFANLSFSGGEMQIDGDLQASIAGELLQLDASLRSSRIDLMRLLPEDDPGEAALDAATVAGDREQRLFPDDPLPVEIMGALETVTAAVNIDVGELILDPDTTLSNLNIGLNIVPKTISVKPLQFNAMGAAVNGRAKLKLVDQEPRVSAKLNIRHPDFGSLLDAGNAAILTGGRLNLDIDVTGDGVSVHEIMASLNGSLEVELGTARVNNRLIQSAFTDIKSIMDKPGESGSIGLHCVITKIGIRDGIAVPSGLVIDMSGVSLFGRGQINLRDESLRLDFDRLAAGRSAASILPPFKVRGTLAAPTGKVDTKALVDRALLYGAALATKSEVKQMKVAAKTGPERCRQRLVVFEQVKKDREESKDKAVEAATDKAVEKVQGLFDRLLKKRKNR